MNHRKLWFSVLAFVLLSTVAAYAQTTFGPTKIEPKILSDLQAKGTTTFFVVMAEQADTSLAVSIEDWNLRGQVVVDALQAVANRTQAPILARLASAGAEAMSFWIVNTIKVTTSDEQLIKELADRPDVAYLKADVEWRIPEPMPGVEEPTIQAVEWGVARVRAPEVWQQFGVRGEGIVVANIDTGVQHTHPALVLKYRGRNPDGTFNHNYNWHDPSRVCPAGTPCDNNSHGTHTMGTIVGDDGGTNQIGVAPGATWIAAKGCESFSCSTGALLSSGQWVLAPTDLNGQNPRPDLRPHVVNNSWGGDTSDPFYRATVQNWRNAGIFPAFANGNPGSACGQAGIPGVYPESFGVGATDIGDNIAWFSGRGPAGSFGGVIKPNVSAPGVNVRSSVPGGYANFSGTSMAAPHVAGAVALLWSARPSLSRDVTRTFDILQRTSRARLDSQCGSAGPPNNVYGWGIIDALEAVRWIPACTYFISPSRAPARPGGGAGSISVTAPSECNWTATSNVSWITITSGGSGRGNGMVTYSVAANTSPNGRTGALTIAGRTFTVVQHWVGGTIYVNRSHSGEELGTPDQPFRTVNAANNFAWDGAQIQIQVGSYPEAVTFSKRLTLTSNEGLVTIGENRNSVIPEAASVQAGASTWITVSTPFRGDDNANSYTVYEYGTSSSGPWTQACGNGTAGESAWRHCAFGELTPNRDYFVKVTFIDLDGVVGTNPQIIGPVRTPATSVAAVTVGNASASVQDKHILVSVPISQDFNLNSRLRSVEIATSSSGPWTQKCAPHASFNPKLCRVSGLTQNTDYWVRVTVSDPDGVTGPNPQIIGPVRYTGLTNLALNKPITADQGWGCCPDPRELVDGRIQNPDWFYGFAWTGGTDCWAGGCPPGFKQATIDLGRPQEVGRVDWWTQGPENVPTTWKVLVSTDGSTYTEVFSTTEPRCRTTTQRLNTSWGFPSCGHGARFGPVTARYVRYSFDDRTLFDGIHGWAVEIEVYSAAAP